MEEQPVQPALTEGASPGEPRVCPENPTENIHLQQPGAPGALSWAQRLPSASMAPWELTHPQEALQGSLPLAPPPPAWQDCEAWLGSKKLAAHFSLTQSEQVA